MDGEEEEEESCNCFLSFQWRREIAFAGRGDGEGKKPGEKVHPTDKSFGEAGGEGGKPTNDNSFSFLWTWAGERGGVSKKGVCCYKLGQPGKGGGKGRWRFM